MSDENLYRWIQGLVNFKTTPASVQPPTQLVMIGTTSFLTLSYFYLVRQRRLILGKWWLKITEQELNQSLQSDKDLFPSGIFLGGNTRSVQKILTHWSKFYQRQWPRILPRNWYLTLCSNMCQNITTAKLHQTHSWVPSTTTQHIL